MIKDNNVTDLTYQLPTSQLLEPTAVTELADFVQQAYESSTPVYTVGGQTAIHYGLAATQEGWGLSTAKLNEIVDFPEQERTISVALYCCLHSR